MKQVNKKIAWLFTTMGYGEQLLYWEPILSELTNQAPNTLVFLTPGKVISEGSNLTVSETIKIFRVTLRSKKDHAYNRIISIINPNILIHIWKYKPDIIVLSEFGLLTIYGVIYRILRPKCKALLLVESHPGPLPAYRTIMRRIICKFTDAIMTNNISGKNYLQDILKITNEKIICKPYLVSEPIKGISENNALNNIANEYINSKKIKILYVGQLAKRKGIDNLLKAISHLDGGIQDHIQLAIVGAGSDTDTKRLGAITRDLNITQHVSFVGRVPYNDLDIIYKNSDIFVLPTLNDYRALVGFEAISYGLPVLLSIHDGSSKEIVEEDKNGYTFDPNDIEDFSGKLKILITDKEKRQDFSKHSLLIASTFTSKIAADNLVDTVKQCLSKN